MMDSLYERCRNNKLIFTKLRPQTSPENTDDTRSLNGGGSRNTELEEIFTRRSTGAATRLTSTSRRHPNNDGDGTELDSDLDECRSEMGSEIFSEAGNVTRRNPKFNRSWIPTWTNAVPRWGRKYSPRPGTANQITGNAQHDTGPFGAERVDRVGEKFRIQFPREQTVRQLLLEPGDDHFRRLWIRVHRVTESSSRVNKLCGNFYWNLVTIISVAFGFVFTELVLKQTVKLLQVAKVWIEHAGNYLWNNFLAPMGTSDGKQWSKPGAGTAGVDNILLLALVVPAVLILAVLYAIVWVLYFLNVILLTEIPLF
ncbi:hypothetical protein RP20_CCG027272 [Aedes albopictus]|nr:hypothetical protein RP20_CCG027272 [Aedes albopictus]